MKACALLGGCGEALVDGGQTAVPVRAGDLLLVPPGVACEVKRLHANNVHHKGRQSVFFISLATHDASHWAGVIADVWRRRCGKEPRRSVRRCYTRMYRDDCAVAAIASERIGMEQCFVGVCWMVYKIICPVIIRWSHHHRNQPPSSRCSRCSTGFSSPRSRWRTQFVGSSTLRVHGCCLDQVGICQPSAIPFYDGSAISLTMAAQCRW